MQLGRPVATGVVVERAARIEEERGREMAAPEAKQDRGGEPRASGATEVEVPSGVAGR
ncbi:hypothetical protein [Embleya scabrispora]|uniref:hypothetical protein n=1 Tax=Embleya scabrispora TaxID=159449 RepID=UPI00037DB63F|nr:hypothetical protein [Embleya scabrispora]MYS84168.1 hypothetical protein [Streptomyces sp. SID5474]